MTGLASLDRDYACGTRSAYVRGCRCAACKAANNAAASERTAKLVEARADVTPSGPPIPSTMLRGGVTCRIVQCPGAGGRACVQTPATWLREQKTICTACVDRAAVWNGLVDPARARAHLRALSAAGVGYKTVAAACDVGHTTLCRILTDDTTPIRARVERAVLGVDVGAKADGALVDAADTNAAIATLRGRGFTLRHLARLVGYASNTSYCQLGRTERVTLATAAKVDRLLRRALRGELAPDRAWVEALAEYEILQRCFAAGLTERWLSNAIGVSVHKAGTIRMRHATIAAIRDWLARTKEQLAEGLPDGWNLANASAVADAFSWGGGFSVSGSRARTPRAKKTPEERKAHRRAYAAKWKRTRRNKEEHNRQQRERKRAQRAALGVEVVRAQNAAHARASRARKRAEREAALVRANLGQREAVAA